MILTVTPNPSIDRTVALDEPLRRGGVHRLANPDDVAGGKGINVARVLAAAGIPTLALTPAPAGSVFLGLLEAEGLPVDATPATVVRTNLTLVERDGTTTKLNETGAELSPEQAAAFGDEIRARAADSELVVIAGSLPPGLPDTWTADVVRELRARGITTVVDTSGAPLRQLLERDSLPDLMKPNAFELTELVGGDGAQLEADAERGDYALARERALRLVAAGCETVLLTLGAAGALAVRETGAWVATPPPITPRSTVGAGDSSLAGWLIGAGRGDSPAECLRRAVATGSAAASLPGTSLPTPEQIDLERTRVRDLDA